MGQCGAFLQFLVDMVQSSGGGGPPLDPVPPLPLPLKQRPGGTVLQSYVLPFQPYMCGKKDLD